MLVLHLALAVLELDELRSQDVEPIEEWCCVCSWEGGAQGRD